jgi:2-polyprenyl-3-methyl-5-hydroxy-6-metoxy-1,4-benzoquinol methylase
MLRQEGAPRGDPATVDGDYTRGSTLLGLNTELASGMADWPRFASCPVCASADIDALAVVRHMPYDRCRSCGFVFCNPYPPEAVRDAFYNSAFYTNYRVLEDHMRERDPYFSISMYTDMRALASRVAEFSPTRVLDYGCGTGSLLALLRDEFDVTEAHGLEISAQARERADRAYGLDIAGRVEDLPYQSYDMVLLLEVIEHVPDPDAFFAEMARLISPGGVVVVTTPAVDNLIGHRAPQHCLHYTAPSHVSLFTSRAMHVLLEKHGFSSVRFDTDPAVSAARTLARSKLYALDFKSPEHDEDRSDALYRPTRLGRLLGRAETRHPVEPSGVTAKALSIADRALARWAPRPDHLYVIARRQT